MAAAKREFLEADPRRLRLPPSRIQGADPLKLARQIAKYGKSVTGMPPLFVVRGRGGALQIVDGVTRATRVAKLLPGRTVTVEVVETRVRLDLARFPTVGEKLP